MTAQAPLKRHFAETLAFIKRSITKNGYSPTVREIMAVTAEPARASLPTGYGGSGR